MARLLSLGDLVKESGIPRHRICYALATGRLKEPARLKNRRCFSPRDLERVKQFFAVRAVS